MFSSIFTFLLARSIATTILIKLFAEMHQIHFICQNRINVIVFGINPYSVRSVLLLEVFQINDSFKILCLLLKTISSVDFDIGNHNKNYF